MPMPDSLKAIRQLPKVRRRRLFSPILGFEPHEILAVGIVCVLMLPYWPAAVLAFITACGLQPIIRKVEKHLHFYQGNFAFVIVALMSTVVVGMTTYTAVRVARLTIEFAASQHLLQQGQSQTPSVAAEAPPGEGENTNGLPPSGLSLESLRSIKERVMHFAERFAPNYRRDFDTFLGTLPKTVVTWIATHAQDFVGRTFEVLTQLAFYFLLLFFFLARGRRILINLMRRPEARAPRMQLWYEMIEKASYTSVVSTAAIGFIQACIVSFTYLVLGMPEWGLIFFVCFMLSFVPMLGAATVPFVVGLFSLISGDAKNAAIFFILCAFVGTIDNFLRAWLVSSDKEVSQIIAFVGLIGAITLLGFPGLLIGPFLISLSAILMSNKTKEGFRPL